MLRDDYQDGVLVPSARLYAQQDANYDTTALVNTSGTVVERYTYSAYGVVTVLDASGTPVPGNTSAYGWQYLFQGGRLDSVTGNVQFAARDYDPTTGVWTQADPLGLGAGDLNDYQFVGGNPVDYVDPTGLLSQEAPQGPFGPVWNSQTSQAEVYFVINLYPSWYDAYNPWYSPSSSLVKSFPIPQLSQSEATRQGLLNLDPTIRTSVELQIAYATGIRNALTEGYNHSTDTARILLGAAGAGMGSRGKFVQGGGCPTPISVGGKKLVRYGSPDTVS